MKYKIITSLYLFVFTLKAQIQSPSDFLGYQLGERFTRHHRVIEYFQHVTKNSQKILLKEYGNTYEYRPLVYAIISSEKNLSQIDLIKTDNLKRTGIITGTPTTQIPIVWLSYNVHGNESVSTEASMATLYELLKPNSEKANWLEKLVVIIDPCLNPDGRDRYVNFYNQYGNAQYNPDPQSKEHAELYPSGRANHYLFDLNRDWAWMTQIESQKRIPLYNQWMPQIHVDFHEQGVNNPYYFAPAANPHHELISPWQKDLQIILGKNHAKYFDKNGWLYFTKERFDLLYPSYGDTYPTYNGAIGMTYEQAGGGRAGLGILTDENDTLTLKARIQHHLTTGISTIEVIANNIERTLKEFQNYFSENKNNFKGQYKTFIIKAENPPAKLEKLTQWLNTLGIQHSIGTTPKLLKGYNYTTNNIETFTTTENDIIISCYQPKGILAHILFEPKTTLTDSITYDITAWATPYSQGLKAFATTEKITPTTKQYTPPQYEIPETAPYAYIATWTTFKNAQFLSYLLKNEVKVRYAETPFSLQGKTFNEGTLIITRKRNEALGEKLDQLIKKASTLFSQEIYTTTTGFVDSGSDFGSSAFRFIKTPKIAVLFGNGVSSLSFGEIWHLFEQQLQYNITTLPIENLKNIALHEYHTIILPNGSYSSIKEEEMKKIDEYISEGGKIIAIQEAIYKFLKRPSYQLKEFENENEIKEHENKNKKYQEEDKKLKYKDRERNEIQNYIPGAIFKAYIDKTHPLAFGYTEIYYSLKTSEERFATLPPKNAWNVATFSTNSLTSGFAGHRIKKTIDNSLLFGVENNNKGTIIYMVDNPLFRSFWEEGKLLFANAIFFVAQ
ncbi:MAG: M14 family metallopeptidase [Chitinophagaceae bacterium]|nr:M14 family metallopeptidase [Chitinophagaceae bacterium]